MRAVAKSRLRKHIFMRLYLPCCRRRRVTSVYNVGIIILIASRQVTTSFDYYASASIRNYLVYYEMRLHRERSYEIYSRATVAFTGIVKGRSETKRRVQQRY